LGIGLFHIVEIGLDGKFRPQAYVENRLHPQGFEEAVHPQVFAVKTGRDGGGHNTNHGNAFFQVPQKGPAVVYAFPGLMIAGIDTLAAPYTEIAVVIHHIAGTVVAHFHRANHDAAVTINAFFFNYPDNRAESRLFHISTSNIESYNMVSVFYIK
jgi:hypothetical protein